MSRFLRYKPNPRIETKTKRILGERNNDAVLNPASHKNACKPSRKRSYTHPEVYMLSGLSTCSEANAICNEMIYATAVRFYA
ncbi:hypothetical protein U9M48_019747 [Paspalum notatum var. saurae]|uniref:Uncharacterized protein n=1 Tax=Paspalum notatum var. saurae TaxID=547442 RepID=A0AAQ3WR87_PASNO